MSFYLPKIIWFFVNPMTLFLLLISVGVLLSLPRRWRRYGHGILLFCAVCLMILAFLPVGRLMIAALESRFPPVYELPEKVDGVIVLGGSFDLRQSESRGQPVLNDNAERIIAFADLVNRYPDAHHVFTGGSGELDPSYLREADIAARVLRQMGIDTTGIIFEAESRNTYEHPSKIRELIEPKPDETWVLITSAYHMPRAVGVFRAQNWPVVAYPVDYRTSGVRRTLGFRFGLVHGLNNFAFGSHNWAGLIAYYLLGRTSEFLPMPEPAAG